MLSVKPVPAFRDNYIWLLTDSTSTQVAVVDPGDASPVREYLRQHQLTLCAIIATHHHADHVGGIAALLDEVKVPVFGPATESIPGCTTPVKEGDRIRVPGLAVSLQVLEVPGHTAGHVAYHGHGMAFVGDTLFMAGCGRLFEGTAAQMHASLGRIAALPPDTQIYCAHEYTEANLKFARAVEPQNAAVVDRTADCRRRRAENLPTVPGPLAGELATNPFLRCHTPLVVRAAEQHCGHALNGPVETFAVIRQWKDYF